MTTLLNPYISFPAAQGSEVNTVAIAFRSNSESTSDTFYATIQNPGNLTDCNAYCGSFWVRRPSGVANTISTDGAWLYSAQPGSFGIEGSLTVKVDTDWTIRVNIGGFSVRSNNQIPDDDSWHHVAFTCNPETSSVMVIDRDNANYTLAGTQLSNSDVSRPAGVWGAASGNRRSLFCDVYDLIISTENAEMIDFANVTNLNRVISTDFKAPDLGANGSAWSPSGTRPELYFKVTESIYDTLTSQGSKSTVYTIPTGAVTFGRVGYTTSNGVVGLTDGPISATGSQHVNEMERRPSGMNFGSGIASAVAWGLDGSAITDTANMTISFWASPDDSSVYQIMAESNSEGIAITRQANHDVRITGRNTAGSIIYQADFTIGSRLATTNVQHFALSVDLTDNTKSRYFYNGNTANVVETVFINDVFKHSCSNLSISGNTGTVTDAFDGRIGLYYYNNEYANLTGTTFLSGNQANSRPNWALIKANGSGVTGNTPPIFNCLFGESLIINFGSLGSNYAAVSGVVSASSQQLRLT